MANVSKNNADLSVDEKICRAEKQIKKFFKQLPADKLKFISEPIHQLAVTQILLERLAEELKNGDLIEWFEQGTQRLRRENPALKSYNATLKSYTALFKQLLDVLPDAEANKVGQALMSFVAKAPTSKK